MNSNFKEVEIETLLLKIQSGFASGERTPQGVIQVRMNNLTTDGSLDLKGFIRVPASERQIEEYGLLPNDVLFNSTNSPELVGKSALFARHREPVVFSNHFFRLQADNSKLNAKYLTKWLVHQWNQRTFEGLCTQWVNQASVRKEDFLSLRIPLPSLPEQKRIAAILDKADRLRRQRRYAQTLSDSFLQSVFIKMFGDPVGNPKEWKVCSVEELCAIVVDCPHSTPTYANNRTPFACIRTSDIQEGVIDWSTTKYVDQDEYKTRIARYQPDTGDVLYSREGERFGLAAQVPSNTLLCLGQRMMLLKANARLATNEFLCSLMNSKQIYRQAERLVGGSTSPHVNVGDIKNFEAICPPLSLQEKFAAIVQKFERIRRQQREATRQAEHLFQTLLHRAFRGEL